MKPKILLITYYVLLITFSVFSYSQIDLNLTLSKNPLYLAFQKQMTSLGYYHRPLSTTIFVVLSLLLITYYLLHD